MSRPVMFGAVLAIIGAATVSSCAKSDSGSASLTFADTSSLAKTVGPVQIHVACDSVLTVALTDSLGNSGWDISKKKKDPITWLPDPNVTIDYIRQKGGQPMPLDSAGDQGGAPGKSYRSTVHDNNTGHDLLYHYTMRLTCDRAVGPDVPVIIDPDFIIRH
jgi:hypothetical protein